MYCYFRNRAHWFSTMDLASSYNHVSLSERDKGKSAFCTPFGLFEWNRMSFGLCQTPSTFERLMEKIFVAQHCTSLLLYLDDVVVFSSSVAEHVECLDVVLGRQKWKNVPSSKQRSTTWFMLFPVLVFPPIPRRLMLCQTGRDRNMLQSLSCTALRSFLRFASYYRCFIEGFSKLAGPLLVAQLMGPKTRNGPWKHLADAWTEECEAKFCGPQAS